METYNEKMHVKFQEKIKCFIKKGFETKTSFIYLDRLWRNTVLLQNGNSNNLLL